jgi:hypothetical protein
MVEVTISGNSALAMIAAASSMTRRAGSGAAVPSGRMLSRREWVAGLASTSRGSVKYTGPRGSLIMMSSARSTTASAGWPSRSS